VTYLVHYLFARELWNLLRAHGAPVAGCALAVGVFYFWLRRGRVRRRAARHRVLTADRVRARPPSAPAPAPPRREAGPTADERR
jgi:hypothetical protein